MLDLSAIYVNMNNVLSQCEADAENHWLVLAREQVLSWPRIRRWNLGISPLQMWMARIAFDARHQHPLANHHRCHLQQWMMMYHSQTFVFECLNAVSGLQAQVALGLSANVKPSWWIPELWVYHRVMIASEFMVAMDNKGDPLHLFQLSTKAQPGGSTSLAARCHGILYQL